MRANTNLASQVGEKKRAFMVYAVAKLSERVQGFDSAEKPYECFD